jgi:hypothetical protein
MGAFQYFRVPMRSCKCLKTLEISALQNQYSRVQIPFGAPYITSTIYGDVIDFDSNNRWRCE